MDNVQLFKCAFTSAAKWVQHDFTSKKLKNAFVTTSLTISDKIYFENLHDLKLFLEEKIFFLEQNNKWYSINKYNPGEMASYLLALDVCESIIRRFIDGGEGEGQLLVNGK